MKIPSLRDPEERKLSAANGATAREFDPLATQAIERVKQGKLSVSDFNKLYKANVKAGLIEGKNRHSPKYGFSKWKSTDHFMQTLSE